MGEFELSIEIPPDEHGMVGCTCPDERNCGRYFKLKPGTGLPIDDCHCPYCGIAGDSADFITADQMQLALSHVSREIVDPMMREFGQNLRGMNAGMQGGPIAIRFDLRYAPTRLHSYVEEQLETDVTCDRCGLEFAVYGVFASCPDCQQLNALKTFTASLSAARKRVRLAEEDAVDADLRERLPRDAIADAVSAFDAYGKALRARMPTVISRRAKANLYQDLTVLDRELQSADLGSLASMIGDSADRLAWLFQARHVYQHNAGVVDGLFVSELPPYPRLEGRLLPLPAGEVLSALDTLERLARAIDSGFQDRAAESR